MTIEAGKTNFWALTDKRSSDVRARLEEALGHDSIIAIPLDADAEIATLLDSGGTLRGTAWLEAAEALFEQTGRDYGEVFAIPGGAPAIDDIEKDVAVTLDEVRKSLPGLRVAVIHQHRFVESLLDAKDPLHDDMNRLVMEAGVEPERARHVAQHASDILFHGSVLRHEHRADIIAPESRSWHVLILSSNLENNAALYPARNTSEANIAQRVPLPSIDSDVFVTWANQHEIAHLISRHAYQRGQTPSDDYETHLEECIADAAAVMRCVQKFGADRALHNVIVMSGYRDINALTVANPTHWTSPILRTALAFAEARHADGTLQNMDLVDMTDIARRRILGPQTSIVGAETPDKKEGGRWPVLNRFEFQRFGQDLANFHDESQGVPPPHERSAFRQVIEGYFSARLLGALRPSEPLSDHIARLQENDPGLGAAAKALPHIERIAEGHTSLFLATQFEYPSRAILSGIRDAAGGYGGLFLLEAQKPQFKDADRDILKRSGKSLNALASWASDALKNSRNELSAARYEKVADTFRTAANNLPGRLGVLARNMQQTLELLQDNFPAAEQSSHKRRSEEAAGRS